MQVRSVKISELSLNAGQIEGLPANPRFIRDERYAELVKSIQDDPEMIELRELIVYPLEKKYIVICGNMRLRALRELGHKSAPCKVLDVATPLKKLKAYAIKDNISFGEHDWDALANGWDGDELAEWGLRVPGWVSISPDGLGEDFSLTDGDRAPFQQITFTLADAQAERVKQAIKDVEVQPGTEYGNENSNGNALHQIVLEWAEQRTYK